MIYFVVLLLLLMVEYITIFNTELPLETKQNYFLWLVFIEISLFIGLRDELSSVDTATYLKYFYDAGNPSIFSMFRWDEFEIGYTCLNLFVYWIFGYSPIAILTIVGALSIGPILWTLRGKTHILVSVFTWCILNGLTTAIGNQRQGMAIGWCLLGYYFLMNKKYWSAIIAILIASSFHFSAICMLIVLVIYYISKRIKFTFSYLLGLILPCALVGIFVVRPLLVFLTETSGMYSSYLSRHNSALGAILYCVISCSFFILAYIAYYFQSPTLPIDKKNNFKFLLLMSLAGFLMYVATINGGSNRMAQYFTCIYVWLIPLILDTFEHNKKMKLVAIASVMIGLGLILAGFYFFPSSFELAKYNPFFVER